ncbi:MAG: branched-chain alpha-keto acid dehydrogenase subunit E2 [Nitrososphaerota archaeon]
MSYEFKLPDLGEGLLEAEVVRWRVKEGDVVKENDPLVEVLTEKATVEIPSPVAGRVAKLLAKEGERVKVGQTLIVIETPEAARKEAALPEVKAMPAARRRAKELGIALEALKGTGPGGIITLEDVERAALARARPPAEEAKPKEVLPAPPAPLAEERIPLRGIRRRIAEKMVESKRLTAAVTHVEEADFTRLRELRERLKPMAEERGVKLTYLPFIIKLLIPVLKRYPLANAVFDEQKQEIVVKKYYNIGIAVDTSEGLIVPVVKEADKKGLFQLAQEIEELAKKAREGRISLDEIREGTFTITNIGPYGGLFATPIINYPEVAILGLSRISPRPIAEGGQIKIADIGYLMLTFDHRVFDGAYAASLASLLASYIKEPSLALFEPL